MEETLAQNLVHALRAAGVNFITYLPETRLSQIIPLLQNDTHFQLACYNILTVGVRYGVPMLLLVSYVGSFEDQRNSFLYVQRGIKLIPQLEALEVQYQVIGNGEGVERKVKNAVRMMNALKQPVALLFTEDFTL